MQLILALLLCFLVVPAFGAVTRPDTPTLNLDTTDGATSPVTVSHTTTAGTNLLVVAFCTRGVEDVTGVDFNSSAMTEIDRHPSTGNAGDMHIVVYAMVSPTITTANIEVTNSGDGDFNGFNITTGANYKGTETASVAAATNSLGVDGNDSASSDTDFASAGTAGNALAAAACLIGGDGEDVTNVQGFTEAVEDNTGADGGSQDGTVYVIEDLNASGASAVNIDWAVSDENAGVYFEIVAAAASNVGRIVRRRREHRTN